MSIVQVILGNDVLLKCDIPSFATDFVSVVDWVDSEGVSLRQSSLGNNMKYNKSRPSCKSLKEIQATLINLLLFS